MPPVAYTKPALTFAAQLQQLKNRGLVVENDTKAIHLLESISYFRLSGYWYPLLETPKSTHTFKPKSTFNQSFSLYCFDRELRQLLYSELEKIEVAIRSKMIYVLSHQYGAFWYTNPALFSRVRKHTETLAKLTSEYERSNEDFILAFRTNYTDPLPPSWMILEVSSFGNLSHLYENLRPNRSKRDIADHFGLDTSTLTSWIHGIGYIRNLCAHHSRLWNKKLSISPTIPITPTKQWLNTTTQTNTLTGTTSLINNRTYYILSMTLYFLQTINPHHTFKRKIFRLLKKYPNVDPAAMGFTANWRSEPLWKLDRTTFLENIKKFFALNHSP
jgi:abortive infection bacteriophage resistance protein